MMRGRRRFGAPSGIVRGVVMYRKPRFLEKLHQIREEMARECDYDPELLAEMVRSGRRPLRGPVQILRGRRTFAASDGHADESSDADNFSGAL
jgi:hypothetical protein